MELFQGLDHRQINAVSLIIKCFLNPQTHLTLDKWFAVSRIRLGGIDLQSWLMAMYESNCMAVAQRHILSTNFNSIFACGQNLMWCKWMIERAFQPHLSFGIYFATGTCY